MGIKDVEAKVAEIAQNAWDDPTAHKQEDDLYEEVLEAIAGGAKNAAELARAALITKTIDFARWYE